MCKNHITSIAKYQERRIWLEYVKITVIKIKIDFFYCFNSVSHAFVPCTGKALEEPKKKKKRGARIRAGWLAGTENNEIQPRESRRVAVATRSPIRSALIGCR